MMAINHKQLNNAQAIDISRVDAKSDRIMAERMMDARLLAAASMQVEGKRKWFALRTAHRSEFELCEMLVKALDIDAVVPMKKVQVKCRRPGARGRVVHKPVLRGLVFVQLVPSPLAFAGLLRVRGIEAVIGSHERPHPIGEKEMNAFMDLAQAGAFDERNAPTGLKVGSKVRIKVGPFAEMDGVLEGYAPKRNVRVLTHLFGRGMTVELTLAQIERLD